MFKNETILITGITGGLGIEILAQLIKQKPRRLVLLGRNREKLLNLQSICKSNKVSAAIHSVDFLSANIEQQFDSILEKEKNLSVIIHNAGYLHQQDSLASDWLKVKKETCINYLAPAYLTKKFCAERLRASGLSRIINILSLACLVPAPTFSGYGASKTAYKHFCDSLRLELDTDKIKITNCILGQFESAMTADIEPYRFVPSRSAKEMAELLFDELRYFPNSPELNIGFEVRGAALLKKVSPRLLESIAKATKPNLGGAV